MPPHETLTVPAAVADFLAPYLPPAAAASAADAGAGAGATPFVTLTYATSLDSNISLAPGVQTALSGAGSKALTHYLRSQHDAILVGSSTAIADDPGLNCRIAGASQPRPVVVDRNARWAVSAESRMVVAAAEGRGKGPWVLVAGKHCGTRRVDAKDLVLRAVGGKVVFVDAEEEEGAWPWEEVLAVLGDEGVGSVMIEGGAGVINGLLREPELVDSVVVTVAPVYLGQGGVNVSPQREEEGKPAATFDGVNWMVLERDVVMAARPVVRRG
ncbi:riboflavin biosynthesis protein RibD domain-containing protein [Geopyxis carbonaria]|nr:riboflavin biosynthesis protein RibD domain-containing protein [Geopyxis carbonaria]